MDFVKKFFITIFIFAIFCLTFFPRQTFGQGLFLPFGGKVLNTQFCNDGILLTVGPPKGGLYYVSYAVAYKYLQYTVGIPGINVLGLASYFPFTCILGNTVVGVGFTTLLIGSSYPSK